ncbi:MAG: terpene utilization protein AtuA [Leptospiraceae bacterium]|nr:MAG: terpene utilization protein AtuA [Leptospiraceae bacterium]
MKKHSILIGNAGGFWGDDFDAFRKQIELGKLHYLTLDYLAEVTMSILRKMQLKNPDSGYIADFILQIKNNLDLIVKNKIKIITNAGGLNPVACGEKILEILKQNKLQNKIRVAVVYGDNIFPEIEKYKNQKFKNLDHPEIKFQSIKKNLEIANVYFGAKPIVEALKEKADIIITGRVTDAALVMAPMIYEFNWKENDWDKLASSLVAGHLIECGTQVTGGNFTDWHLIQNWDLGYPIIEAFSDGTFIVKKHKNTGGLINKNTIREQLLYEIGDPYNYISPDVIADFNSISIEEKNTNTVLISKVKGKPPTSFYKVSMGYKDGYKVFGELILSGPKVKDKASIVQEILENKISKQFYRYNVSLIGYNSCHKNLISYRDTNEILIRFYAHDYDKTKLEEFTKKIPSLVLSGPPGISYTGGRQKISEVIAYYPTLIDKKSVQPQLLILNPKEKTYTISLNPEYEKSLIPTKPQISNNYKVNLDFTFLYNNKETLIEVSFYDICLARSGDKGDKINLGIIARSKEIYDFLKEYLTADYIKFLFRDICKGNVLRYEIPNLEAFNFILEDSLEGGGTRSLQIDAQGKTIAQAFLNQTIKIPKTLLNTIQEK